MLRLLIAILLFYAIFRLVRLAFRPGLRSRTTERKNGALPAEMVACAACGTFIISAEAERRDGRNYCSAQCADQKT